MQPLDDVVPMRLRDLDPQVNRVTGAIVDAAMRVRRALGGGLFEGPYEHALAYELTLRGCRVARQVPVDASYCDLVLPRAYVIDLVVEGLVAVELKAVDTLVPRHFAQAASGVRFGGYPVGLLINFHASPLKNGIHRLINPLRSPPLPSA